MTLPARRATPRRRTAPRWTAEQWEEATRVLRHRCRGRCEVCGQPLAGREERHHRKRRRDGGDRLANLMLLHPECHGEVTGNPSWARARGYIVIVREDPAEVPVHLFGVQWVLLDDAGGCTIT